VRRSLQLRPRPWLAARQPSCMHSSRVARDPRRVAPLGGGFPCYSTNLSCHAARLVVGVVCLAGQWVQRPDGDPDCRVRAQHPTLAVATAAVAATTAPWAMTGVELVRLEAVSRLRKKIDKVSRGVIQPHCPVDRLVQGRNHEAISYGCCRIHGSLGPVG
jgi:hypothetical protein